MAPDTVRFSIIIPTYNRAPLIGRAVGCALRQTFPAHEIVVVDDGSTDDTIEVVRGIDARVQVIPLDHGGPSRARNRGVALASGEWIAFLDSDDLWHPDYLERMAHAIRETGGEAAIYFSDVEYQYGRSRVMHWSACGFSPERAVTLFRDGSTLAMMGTHPMLIPFSVFRKEAYLHLGGLWEELWSAEDTHLFIKMGLREPLCAVGGSGGVVTADERDPENRLTVAFNTATIKRWRGMVKRYRDLLENVPSLSVSQRKVLRTRLAHSYWRISRLAWADGCCGDTAIAFVSSLRADFHVIPSEFRRIFIHSSALKDRKPPGAQ
ncbi:MAG TPA: glycosyltransferase family 2 protein [Bacteroidota bacterium]|nr:glycosyltransferase family 2 protein [Bacteroidota bacterium]